LKPKAKAELNTKHQVSSLAVANHDTGTNDIDSDVVKMIKQKYKTAETVKNNSRNKSKSNLNTNEYTKF